MAIGQILDSKYLTGMLKKIYDPIRIFMAHLQFGLLHLTYESVSIYGIFYIQFQSLFTLVQISNIYSLKLKTVNKTAMSGNHFHEFPQSSFHSHWLDHSDISLLQFQPNWASLLGALHHSHMLNDIQVVAVTSYRTFACTQLSWNHGCAFEYQGAWVIQWRPLWGSNSSPLL